MADVNSVPQNGPVLSYTVTKDRGWNDPPPFAFSPNATSNRKRIDPRKRMAHNISSTGNGYTAPIQAASFQPIQPQIPPQITPQITPQQHYQPPMMNGGAPYINTNITSNGFSQNFQNMSISPTPPTNNGYTQNVQNISLSPTPPTMHHASSNPDLHQQPKLQSSPLHHSTSVPSHMNNAGQGVNRIPGHVPGTMTPPPSSSNTPPIVQLRSGSATPPHSYGTSSGRKLSAPSMPFGNSAIFNQLGTPTMLQSSHLLNKSVDNAIANTNTNNFITNGIQPQILYPASQVTNQLGAPTQMTTAPTTMQSLPTMSTSFSPIPNVDPLNPYGRSNSNPGMFRKTSPTTNVPPPTMGYYSRRVSNGYNSPKVSPGHSGKNSPIPSIDPTLLENDKQVLNTTLKNLSDSKVKCMCNMTSKQSDNINKKIKLFESAWISGKLSAPVKLKMIQLAEALSSSDFVLSDRLHKSLFHEHSNEVTSWLVAIKKLISCCQQAVEENNIIQQQ